MEKINFKNYRLPEKINKSKLKKWQEYALEVIKDFGIENDIYWVEDKNGKMKKVVVNYRAMIFRHACRNISYLMGRVENAKEKFGKENLRGKQKYLIATFRKNWRKDA